MLAVQGSVILRRKEPTVVKHTADARPVYRDVSSPVVLHCDIISDSFWHEHAGILEWCPVVTGS